MTNKSVYYASKNPYLKFCIICKEGIVSIGIVFGA